MGNKKDVKDITLEMFGFQTLESILKAEEEAKSGKPINKPTQTKKTRRTNKNTFKNALGVKKPRKQYSILMDEETIQKMEELKEITGAKSTNQLIKYVIGYSYQRAKRQAKNKPQGE